MSLDPRFRGDDNKKRYVYLTIHGSAEAETSCEGMTDKKVSSGHRARCRSDILPGLSSLNRWSSPLCASCIQPAEVFHLFAALMAFYSFALVSLRRAHQKDNKRKSGEVTRRQGKSVIPPD
jgi:hypothetical protein